MMVIRPQLTFIATCLMLLAISYAVPVNIIQQTHRLIPKGGMDTTFEEMKYCFESEPCQFGQYKESRNDMLAYSVIPSWCICNQKQSCVLDRWDRARKAEIYTCQPVSD